MRLLIFQGIIVFIMVDQINDLPEDELKSLPETSRYTENKWICRKNQNELYFLHHNDKVYLNIHWALWKKYEVKVCERWYEYKVESVI